MWTSLKAALTNILLEIAQKQGFTVALLLIACGFLYNMMIDEKQIREKQMLQLQQQIQECHLQVIEYYREEKRRSDDIINRNSNILERLEQRIRY